VPNLTSWRREAVGDLTSTLGFSRSNSNVPSLPAASVSELSNACPTPTNLAPFLSAPEPVTVPHPGHQQMPLQEAGTARLPVSVVPGLLAMRTPPP